MEVLTIVSVGSNSGVLLNKTLSWMAGHMLAIGDM